MSDDESSPAGADHRSTAAVDDEPTATIEDDTTDSVDDPTDSMDDEPTATSGDEPIGETRWEIPGGFVPVESTGPEPPMVSHDLLCLLNAGDDMASVELTLHYEGGREPGPYPLTVAAERVRHVRINDLIDPYAPPLGEAYGAVVESTVPIVVQHTRLDSRQAANATCSTIAYGER